MIPADRVAAEEFRQLFPDMAIGSFPDQQQKDST